MQKKWISAAVLAVVTAMLAGLFLVAHPKKEPVPAASEYMEYENAVVEQILSDSTESDPVSENHYRGNQNLIVLVKTGQYAGQQMMADNTVGPIYGTPMQVGDQEQARQHRRHHSQHRRGDPFFLHISSSMGIFSPKKIPSPGPDVKARPAEPAPPVHEKFQ